LLRSSDLGILIIVLSIPDCSFSVGIRTETRPLDTGTGYE
jgi:hypothetical protein